ncbi:MAG: glutathione S-transferase family protein [Nevskia sp.]|nr:glutathione S-transferase family protein [Nevskia sp.]
MSELILHHYELSPYSEKIRGIFGYKDLAWRSVITPEMMPKDNQVALTGGYRKAPVMQVGRDIYCDTRLIVRVIERLHPQPPLCPPALAATCAAYGALEPVLFFACVGKAFTPAGAQTLAQKFGPDFLPRFMKDRAALFAGGSLSFPNPEAPVPFAPLVGALEAQLRERPFLADARPTLPDFICFHCLWFVDSNPGVASLLEPYPAVRAWIGRMRALGSGRRSEMPAEQSLQAARAATAEQPLEGAPVPIEGVKTGDKVSVRATDYGCDPVAGTLLHASAEEIAIRRADAKAGELVVHFPRAGFKVSPA